MEPEWKLGGSLRYAIGKVKGERNMGLTGREMSGTPTRRRGPCGGDAEIKGRSAAESERSEDVRSIEG